MTHKDYFDLFKLVFKKYVILITLVEETSYIKLYY